MNQVAKHGFHGVLPDTPDTLAPARFRHQPPGPALAKDVVKQVEHGGREELAGASALARVAHPDSAHPPGAHAGVVGTAPVEARRNMG